jgi:hypothetical protein
MIDIGKNVVELNPINTAANRIKVIGKETKRNVTSLKRFVINFILQFSPQPWLLARVLAGVSNGLNAISSWRLSRAQKLQSLLVGHSISPTDF